MKKSLIDTEKHEEVHETDTVNDSQEEEIDYPFDDFLEINIVDTDEG